VFFIMQTTNIRRAGPKIFFILAVTACLVRFLAHFAKTPYVNTLKHDITLLGLVVTVLIINLTFFSCMVAAYASWRWISRDLKPPKDVGPD
jgi:hypothetical protein